MTRAEAYRFAGITGVVSIAAVIWMTHGSVPLTFAWTFILLGGYLSALPRLTGVPVFTPEGKFAGMREPTTLFRVLWTAGILLWTLPWAAFTLHMIYPIIPGWVIWFWPVGVVLSSIATSRWVIARPKRIV